MYNGSAIVYDDFGNPTNYKGNAATWQHGKLLTQYGSTTFVYDGYGRRIKKGSIIFAYDNEGNLIRQSDGTNTLEFIYDGSGLSGVKCNDVNYLYRKNAQGDITHILDNTGMVVAKYVYDAWGNHVIVDGNGNDLASGVGVLNPFRYRGYYYDTETNLYYLQTRYYDPEAGRFLSQDDVSYLAPDNINGLNLYAYCSNNPIKNIDALGCFLQKNVPNGIDIISIIDIILSTSMAYMYSVANMANRIDVLKMVVNMSSGLANATRFLGYVSVAVNTILNVITNIRNGVSADRIASDVIVDVAIGAGSIWLSAALGSMMGSWLPGIGNLIGAVAGFVIGLVFYMMDDVVIQIKNAFYTVMLTMSNVVEDFFAGTFNWFVDLFN